MLSKSFVFSFVVGSLISIPSFASTKKNAENYIAQQLAQAYTGVQDERVDARVGEALGTLVGCQIGQVFRTEGFAAFETLAQAEISTRLSGRKKRAAQKGLEMALDRAPERLDSALEKNCDKAKWPEKFGAHNLEVASKILAELDPVIQANRDALVRGDIQTVITSLVAEGMKIHGVLKSAGKLKLDSEKARAFAAALDTLPAGDLLKIASALKAQHETACEPNTGFRARQIAEKIRNDISNRIEMMMSPVETSIEKIVEKILGGDGVGNLMQDESVAITSNDNKVHDHLQHELQTAACFQTETDMELVNRELRGTKLGQINRDVTPQEIRTLNPTGRGLKGLLYDIELNSPAKILRDRTVGGAR